MNYQFKMNYFYIFVRSMHVPIMNKWISIIKIHETGIHEPTRTIKKSIDKPKHFFILNIGVHYAFY